MSDSSYEGMLYKGQAELAALKQENERLLKLNTKYWDLQQKDMASLAAKNAALDRIGNFDLRDSSDYDYVKRLAREARAK